LGSGIISHVPRYLLSSQCTVQGQGPGMYPPHVHVQDKGVKGGCARMEYRDICSSGRELNTGNNRGCGKWNSGAEGAEGRRSTFQNRQQAIETIGGICFGTEPYCTYHSIICICPQDALLLLKVVASSLSLTGNHIGFCRQGHCRD